jgi:hypothetical protein|tara:strand:+ start:13327 stop:13671 length:345 start_codon:yes stop_codon:yes gene_type:complete
MNTQAARKDLLQKLGGCWVSCMTMMVQGNFLAVNAAHCVIALRSSFGAVLAFVVMSTWLKKLSIFQESLLLAACMASVDVVVHPTHFEFWWTEAVATGIMAGIINLIVKTNLLK